MFERFTCSARDVLEGSVRQAERLESEMVRAEHMLLALAEATGTEAANLLAEHGVTKADASDALEYVARRAGLSAEESEALRELGIDVEDIVRRLEQAHGTGALRERRSRRRHRRIAPDAKAVLERALREATDLRDRHIGDEHVLLALAAQPGVPAEILAEYGLTYASLRARLRQAG